MRLGAKYPLASKILLLGVVNLLVLGCLFVAFVRWQMGQQFESFLMATARERISAEVRSITLEMREADRGGWDEILQEHSERNGVTFLLFRNDGEQVGGPKTPIPAELSERFARMSMRLREGSGRDNGTREAVGREAGPPREGPSPADRARADAMREALQKGGPNGRNPNRFAEGFAALPFLVEASSASPFQYWVGVRWFMPASNPTERPFRGWFVIASPNLVTNPFFFQLRPWLAIGAGAVLVSFLCWLPLVRGLNRSIQQMTEATARVAEGEFNTQLHVNRRDELGLLAAAINRMASRLDAHSQGQKRFLGDVAHELRSPLGRMQLALGILERKVDESSTDYVHDLSEDVKVMSGLTDELLQFAKAELRPEALPLGPVNIADVVWRAVRAESRPGINVEVTVDPILMVKGETEYLFRAVANVIRNSVRYAGEAGPIAVLANSVRGEVQVTVTDSGPGVPEDSVDQIFEPFYRLDLVRNRESGGSGLGLAIVKSCVEACGGRVLCRNRKPNGLEVSLLLEAA